MERIVINEMPESVKEFFQMPDSLYKNIVYRRNHLGSNYVESDIIKTDTGCIHYCMNQYMIKKGKKYYKKLKSRKGFTLDEKGKLKIWYGSDISNNPHFFNVLKPLNIDWFTDSKNANVLWSFMTKTLFEKILNGKITNPIDYLKGYLKLSRIDASPKLLYDLLRQEGTTKANFLHGAVVAKDVNHYIEYCQSADKFSHMSDFIDQARILERKIDFKWSIKRMNDEHNNWSEEIMKVEMDIVEDIPPRLNQYEVVSPYIPDSFKPLDTKKKVFVEASMMKHCLYTNYWASIDSGFYLAYHIDCGGESATLGLHISEMGKGDKIQFNQMNGKRNQSCSVVLLDYVKKELFKINEAMKRDNVKFNEMLLPF